MRAADRHRPEEAALAGERRRHFTVESWRTIVEQGPDGRVVSEATVKVHAGGERIISTGEGNGPVNALDNALRAGLTAAFPELARLELVDYKVRILTGGTEAVTRVLVESLDRTSGERWFTVGVSANIVDASFEALTDSITYKLFKAGARP